MCIVDNPELMLKKNYFKNTLIRPRIKNNKVNSIFCIWDIITTVCGIYLFYNDFINVFLSQSG